ncbi:ead/Ea22-like family protein, partial [Citrobacter sp. MGH 55]
MSNIDKQALRQTAEKAQEHGVFNMDIHSETLLALLDELEKEKGYASAYEAEKWHYHGLAESEGERADRAEKALEAAEKHIAELEARAFNPAILDVIAERQRQQSVEGWTPEHDDEHGRGEMAMAAVCYINETGTVNRNGGRPWGWPWDASWWKPNTRRRNLVKAGALIIAEIERI